LLPPSPKWFWRDESTFAETALADKMAGQAAAARSGNGELTAREIVFFLSFDRVSRMLSA
jgi:hypothetical protein